MGLGDNKRPVRNSGLIFFSLVILLLADVVAAPIRGWGNGRDFSGISGPDGAESIPHLLNRKRERDTRGILNFFWKDSSREL